MATLGLGSGILANFTYASRFFPLGGSFYLSEALAESSVGYIFGGAVMAYVFRVESVAALKAAALVVLATFSWLVAESGAYLVTAFALAQDVGRPWDEANPYYSLEAAIGGVAGGLVGSLLLVSSCALLFPFWRHLRGAAITVAVGGGLGILVIYLEVGIFFPVWQAAVAGCLGLGLGLESRLR